MTDKISKNLYGGVEYPKRFKLKVAVPGYEESSDGEWVKLIDYEKLIKRNEQLLSLLSVYVNQIETYKGTINELNGQLYNHDHRLY